MSNVNSMIKNKFWDEFHHNGWNINEPDPPEKNDLDSYLMDILVEYGVTCYAWVSTDKTGINMNGHLGVTLIEAKHEFNPPYDYDIAKEVLSAIRYAEDNLLKIGIPFVPDYEFHSSDIESPIKDISKRKIRREWNLEIREEWGLENIEEILNKEITADREAEITKRN